MACMSYRLVLSCRFSHPDCLFESFVFHLSVCVCVCVEVKKEQEEGDEPRAETESESEEELSCFAPTVSQLLLVYIILVDIVIFLS